MANPVKRHRLALTLFAAAFLAIAGAALLFRPTGSSPADNRGAPPSQEAPPAKGEAPAAAATISAGGALRIPLSNITAAPRLFSAIVDGTTMQVVATRTASGELRTAFNACQSCFRSGHGFFRTDGLEIICGNCGQRFTSGEIGVRAGGCNPWPILPEARRVVEGVLEIPYETLRAGRELFESWR